MNVHISALDFASVGRAAAAKGAAVSAVLTQGEFLLRMGIVQRVQQLVEAPSTGEEQVPNTVHQSPLDRQTDSQTNVRNRLYADTSSRAQASGLVSSLKFLVGEGQGRMGRKFKVVCVADAATAYPGFP